MQALLRVLHRHLVHQVLRKYEGIRSIEMTNHYSQKNDVVLEELLSFPISPHLFPTAREYSKQSIYRGMKTSIKGGNLVGQKHHIVVIHILLVWFGLRLHV